MTKRIVLQCNVLLWTAILFTVGSQLSMAETNSTRTVKKYFAEVSVYSLMPGKGIELINGQFSGGGFGPGGTFGTSIMQGRSEIELRFQGQLKDGKFISKLTVSKTVGGRMIELPELSSNLDLTDLEPKTIELAKDADGRLYVARLVPKVIESSTAKRFDHKDLRLEQFSFDESTVILDDQEYLGTMSMFSGELVHLDIASVGKVEFSLIPFMGASEQGQLHNGSITIHHDGKSLQIQRVRNGVPANELQGGPYAVYVRWSPPTSTADEMRHIMKRQLDELRTQLTSGVGTQTEGSLKALERQLDQRKLFMNYGVGPISPKDR